MLLEVRQLVKPARDRHQKEGGREQKRDDGTRYGSQIYHGQGKVTSPSAILAKKMQMNCKRYCEPAE
jgi:hypothetical protein